MKVVKLKLPTIKKSRGILNQEKETSFMKLQTLNKRKSPDLINIPKNVRSINYKSYLRNREKCSKQDKSDENKSINKSFLLKRISIKHKLNLKIDLKKIGSTRNVSKFQKLLPNENSVFNSRSQSMTNDMSLFLLKLDKIFGNKGPKKFVNDISKELINKNENNTNGIIKYDNNEEKKSNSLSNYLDENNIKNQIKMSPTKNILIKKNILKIQPKPISNNFHMKAHKFTYLGNKNIKKIKFFQKYDIAKLKNNFRSFGRYHININESKKNNLISFLKKRIRAIDDKMNYNLKDMNSLDEQMESCLQKSKCDLEILSNIIENEKLYE